MLKQTISIAFFSIFFVTHTNSMIMRNNALMSKMVSQFQGKDNRQDRTNENNSLEPKRPENPRVISMMQNVLCKNFPSIPCELIMKDPALRHLIEQSIEQIKFKKKSLERSTHPPNYQQLTLFPVVNSEDLSNFLKVSDTGFHSPRNNDKTRKKAKKSVKAKNFWSHEAPTKKKETKTEVFNGRKKIRKFYPHKIKYKDKKVKDFGDYSDEKLSMSVEVPESQTGIKKRHFSFRNEQSDSPFWRIDYMKHGEPSVNMFGDSLKGKIVKTGPNVIVDDAIERSSVRRDVLHPDVYIKNNYVRKSSVNTNSDALE